MQNQPNPEALRILAICQDELGPDIHGRKAAADRLFEELEGLAARIGARVEPSRLGPSRLDPSNARIVRMGKAPAVVLAYIDDALYIVDGNNGSSRTPLPLVFNPVASPQQWEGSEREPAIKVVCQAIADYVRANRVSPHQYHARSGGPSQIANQGGY